MSRGPFGGTAAPVADLDYWCIDPVLLDAALAGRLDIPRLVEADRSYVVAALTARGESGHQVAERLKCSRRPVCAIRVKPLTLALLRLFPAERERDHAVRDLAAARGAWQHHAELLHADNQRLRETNHLLVDQLAECRRRNRQQ